MKKLQNDFTTPEQSKLLLEIGVPANSANCYYRNFANSRVRLIPNIRETDDKFCIDTNLLIPCWSVCRLMEIIDICDSLNLEEEYPTTKMVADKCKMEYVEYLVETIKRMKDFGELDFSKLEE